MLRNGWPSRPPNFHWRSSTRRFLPGSWMIWNPVVPIACAAVMHGLRLFGRFIITPALEAPQHAGVIQRVLAIPYKRLTRRLVSYLTRSEVEAILSSVDKSTWVGRRNH